MNPPLLLRYAIDATGRQLALISVDVPEIKGRSELTDVSILVEANLSAVTYSIGLSPPQRALSSVLPRRLRSAFSLLATFRAGLLSATQDVLDAAKESQAAAKARADLGLSPIDESNNSLTDHASRIASVGKRPDSAHTSKGSISTRPRSAASAVSSPAALLNQKSFGMYPIAQIEKFREVWMKLDDDGSGAVDVEELLNANIFASSQMKVTKAIFGSIDADKSGDVSLTELVKVVFPMGGPEVRAQIIAYVKYVIARDRAEKERLKEGGFPLQNQKKKSTGEIPPAQPSKHESASPSSKHVKIIADEKTAEDITVLEAARDARLKRQSR